MREIAVVTGSRADFGILLPVLKKIQSSSKLKLRLMVTGMHLAPEFGLTVKEIAAAGFDNFEKIDALLTSGTPEGISKSMGLGVLGFAQAFENRQPDVLLLLGDRYEIFSAAVAAMPFNIPIAHIHGGEVTEGAMDEAIRHAITKMSHLHFASTEIYSQRIQQLGEEKWRVTVSGAPGLDAVKGIQFFSDEELKQEFDLVLPDEFLLVTWHPVTLELNQRMAQFNEVLSALKDSGLPCLFTSPNADAGGKEILKAIHDWIAGNSQHQLVSSLGTRGYFTVMNRALGMVGNSSSGIIEAASFQLPVVNIGNRQKNRVCGENVLSVGCEASNISEAIRKCRDVDWRSKSLNEKNLYDQGGAADVIVSQLENLEVHSKLIRKKFMDQGI